jgi:hypothetical protein
MRRLAARTLCAIALISSGCGQFRGADDDGFSGTASNGSYGASGAGTKACGLGHPDSECEQCLASTCCDRDAACRPAVDTMLGLAGLDACKPGTGLLATR